MKHKILKKKEAKATDRKENEENARKGSEATDRKENEENARKGSKATDRKENKVNARLNKIYINLTRIVNQL
jgi:hypothetical protein